MMITSLTPGLLYIFGGLFSYFLKGNIQKLFVLSIPLIALFQLTILNSSDSYVVSFLMSNINLLRVDNLSLVFLDTFLLLVHLQVFYMALEQLKKLNIVALLFTLVALYLSFLLVT